MRGQGDKEMREQSPSQLFSLQTLTFMNKPHQKPISQENLHEPPRPTCTSYVMILGLTH
jgi:hypothetical protein